jgi:phosphatidylcholine synthase
VPFPFLHPLRVTRLRRLNIALLLAWSGLAVAAVIQKMEPGIPVKLVLVALAVYFVMAGLLLRESTGELHP